MQGFKRRLKTQESGSASASRTSSNEHAFRGILLAPPEYKVASALLLESFLEWPVQWLGTVIGVSADLEMGIRASVLAYTDSLLRTPMISMQAAVLSVSAHQIKVCRVGSPEVLLRVHLPNLGGVSYVRDNTTHVLAVQHSLASSSEPARESCQLSVMHCETRQSAEEVCAVLRQALQLVFTEATMHFFDSQLPVGAAVGGDDSSSGAMTPSAAQRTVPTHQILSRHPSSAARSDSDVSSADVELLTQFMNKVGQILQKEEWVRFSELLSAWRQGMPFNLFCDRLLDLLAPDKLQLLTELRPFFADADLLYFDKFLRDKGIPVPAFDQDSRRYARSISELSLDSIRSYRFGSTSMPRSTDGSASAADFLAAVDAIALEIEAMDTAMANF